MNKLEVNVSYFIKNSINGDKWNGFYLSKFLIMERRFSV